MERRSGLVLLSAMATVVGLMASGAAASPSSGLQVSVRSNGNLDVVGSTSHDDFEACQLDADTWIIDVYEPGSLTETPIARHVADGVTNDVTFNLRDGNSRMNIRSCLGPAVERPLVAGDLTVIGGDDIDDWGVFNLRVQGDLILRTGQVEAEFDPLFGGSIVLVDGMDVGDDLLARGNGHFFSVSETHVADTVDFKTKGADLFLFLSEFGRTQLVDTGTSPATIQLFTIELGTGIRIATGSGDDVISGENITLSGSLRVRTGGGSDTLELVPSAALDPDRYYLNVNMGAGEDRSVIGGQYTPFGVGQQQPVEVMADVDRQDLLQGGNGTDELVVRGRDLGAKINGFETISVEN